MGDIVNLNQHQPGRTTLAICFQSTAYWLVVLEPDTNGNCIYNHMECPACGAYKSIAIGALMDKFRDSLGRVDHAMPGAWREPVYPELKTEYRELFNPSGNIGDFPPEIQLNT